MISAPSNIALIKYMGKTNSKQNVPTNSSLSFTLKHLRSFVEVTPLPETTMLNTGHIDRWCPLQRDQFLPLSLSLSGQEKFLKHFGFLKDTWGVTEKFQISSANNFPSDCGLASSASSFAALTRASALYFGRQDIESLPALSRRGSGSSCRSFFSPWCLWSVDGDIETITKVDLPYEDFLHLVVVVDDKQKAVSSSEAHRRVSSSSLFLGRPERAARRTHQLLQSLKSQDWQQSYQIVWDEFMDMHDLFHTSQPSFRYMTEASVKVLKDVQGFWEQRGDGPLVTMDAGANVHFLFRIEDLFQFTELRNYFAKQYRIIDSTKFILDPLWCQYGS